MIVSHYRLGHGLSLTGDNTHTGTLTITQLTKRSDITHTYSMASRLARGQTGPESAHLYQQPTVLLPAVSVAPSGYRVYPVYPVNSASSCSARLEPDALPSGSTPSHTGRHLQPGLQHRHVRVELTRNQVKGEPTGRIAESL
eukprot:2270920-Rhodomonas_salina.1